MLIVIAFEFSLKGEDQQFVYKYTVIIQKTNVFSNGSVTIVTVVPYTEVKIWRITQTVRRISLRYVWLAHRLLHNLSGWWSLLDFKIIITYFIFANSIEVFFCDFWWSTDFPDIFRFHETLSAILLPQKLSFSTVEINRK